MLKNFFCTFQDGSHEYDHPIDMNEYVDRILQVVKAHAARRYIVFSSFSPDICAMYLKNKFLFLFVNFLLFMVFSRNIPLLPCVNGSNFLQPSGFKYRTIFNFNLKIGSSFYNILLRFFFFFFCLNLPKFFVYVLKNDAKILFSGGFQKLFLFSNPPV